VEQEWQGQDMTEKGKRRRWMAWNGHWCQQHLPTKTSPKSSMASSTSGYQACKMGWIHNICL